MPIAWSGGTQSPHLLADLLEAQPQSPFPTQDLPSNPRFLATKLVPPTDLSTVSSLTGYLQISPYWLPQSPDTDCIISALSAP